jgi:hypothetical protein
MASTYKAILHGNRLHWRGEAPAIPPDRSLDVTVTVDNFRPAGSEGEGCGPRMAAALTELAAAGGPGIKDPAAWERQMREERSLPDREG